MGNPGLPSWGRGGLCTLICMTFGWLAKGTDVPVCPRWLGPRSGLRDLDLDHFQEHRGSPMLVVACFLICKKGVRGLGRVISNFLSFSGGLSAPQFHHDNYAHYHLHYYGLLPPHHCYHLHHHHPKTFLPKSPNIAWVSAPPN